jgi:deazaflavin-dependent oxidoreductase (nitroreductase family)
MNGSHTLGDQLREEHPMSTDTARMPTWTPPRWLNVMMMAMLRTPGLQRLIGRTIALITVTGRTTGKRYTTPVTYYRDGDTVTVLTKTFRTWWRNLDANPVVDLRLAGRRHCGRAQASLGDPAALPQLIAFLEHRRRDASFYGIAFTDAGHVDETQAAAVLPHLVIITITLG